MENIKSLEWGKWENVYEMKGNTEKTQTKKKRIHRKKRKTFKWHMRNGSQMYTVVFFYSQVHIEMEKKPKKENEIIKSNQKRKKIKHKKAAFAAVNLWRKWNIVGLPSYRAFLCHTSAMPRNPEYFILRQYWRGSTNEKG